ncbi:hypothetical protein [Photobacterium rosenbergii]|uniref:hypothetical protein n=1 Tax=Photobacterium rosenbergii TaxID=294936 RepID=UPI001C99FE3F|nr:hypothetical protein [Photobacterium rosenbergii]MBY5948775.1 hypothetical protein [Photobacterium rosenbergii]
MIETFFEVLVGLFALFGTVLLLEVARFRWCGRQRRSALARRKEEMSEWEAINSRRTPTLPKERLSLTTDKTTGIKLESIDEVIQADNEEYEYQLMICSIAAQATMRRERQATKNKRPKLTIVK